MPRNYQRDTEYKLPKKIYQETVYFIKSYDYKKQQRAEMYHDAGMRNMDGAPRGSSMKRSAVETAVMMLEAVDKDLKAVDQALIMIEYDLRSGVLNNIIYGTRYPDHPSPRTYGRAKAKFIYHVAKNLRKI